VHEQLHTIRPGDVSGLLPAPIRGAEDPGNEAAFAGVIVVAMLLLPSIYYYGFNGQLGVPWDILRGTLDQATASWEDWMRPIMDRFNQATS
jgi:hypothetical protein